jgi:hypothetical protein
VSFARLRESWPEAVALALGKAALGGLVLATGFHAISDDDFARVVIAQRFAETPALDPSGTSWLPLPFWIYGAALALFGSTLAVARAVAVALGVAAVLVLLLAARVAGLGRRAALLGAALAGLFPYSAYLGVATVPEAPTSALTVFGAATLAAAPERRWLGALAIGLATASRYEPWAAAGAFAAISAWQAATRRDRRLAGAALLALAFPVLWAVHGVLHHDSATFFVQRVTSYRAALGGAAPDTLSALLRTPVSLLGAEPELALALIATAATALRMRVLPASVSGLGLGGLTLAAIAGLLVLGDARGSAPTHHGERALLPLWYGGALALGALLDAAWSASVRARTLTLTAAIAGALVGLLAVRPSFPRAGFAARTGELAIGERARARSVDRLAIDTLDFGFFAVQAAFGRPHRTYVLDDRDPRRPRPPDRVTENPSGLAHSLLDRGVGWLALPASRAGLVRNVAVVRETHDGFALLELGAQIAIENPKPGSGSGSVGPAPLRPGPTEVTR